jgi:hypothetical protein
MLMDGLLPMQASNRRHLMKMQMEHKHALVFSSVCWNQTLLCSLTG